MTKPKTRDEAADRARDSFNWQGVVNKLRTGAYAHKLGFLAGWDARDKESKEREAKLWELLDRADDIIYEHCSGHTVWLTDLESLRKEREK